MTAIDRPTATRLTLFLGVVLAMAYAGRASAAPCDGVPLCEPQVMSGVRYSALHTSGWAYYCTGDHPYYWNPDQILGLFGHNYSFDNSCFTVSENPFAEDHPSKFDATITNWCLKHETITVTLGCSAEPQNAVASCPTSSPSKVIKDPGCPTQSGSSRNWCSASNPPVCIQTWTEQCESGGPVYCTDDLTVVWCVTC
jgi:hypothetical protein